MRKQPLFSIVTVVYNGETYVENAINSVLNQGYTNYEYILIDGGSTDGTLDIVKKYREHLSYFISEPDRGIYHAMNKGVRQAKGKLIGFLNADDYLLPGSLNDVAQHHAEYEADVYYGNQRQVWETGNETLERECIPNLSVMGRKMGVFHQATFVSKKVFDDLGGFDESFALAGDYEFLLRTFLRDYSFHYVDSTIAGFRVGGRSSSYKLYWEGYRVQRMHRQQAQGTMLRKLIEVFIKQQIHNKILTPLKLDSRNEERRKLNWRTSSGKALVIQ